MEKPNKIALVYLIFDRATNLQGTLEAIRNFLSRTKSEHDIVLVDAVGAAAFKEAKANKSLTEFLEKGRLHLIEGFGISIADALKEAMNQSQDAGFFLIDDIKNSAQLSTLLGAIPSGKGALSSSDLQLLVATEKQNSLSLYNRIARFKFNAWGNFFGIDHAADLTASIPLLKTSALRESCASFAIQGRSIYSVLQQLLNASSLLGHSKSELRINAKIKPIEPMLRAFASIPKTALKSRLDWFLLHPLRELKGRKAGLLDDGNSSLYRLLFFLSTLFLFFFLPYISQSFGISWDEKAQYDMGKDVLKYLISFGADKSCLDTAVPAHAALQNYGLFFDTFTAFINHYHLSPLGEFETRHLINAIVGFFGILFAGLLARRLFNWRAGLFGLLMLFMSPYYLGHAMNNPKDVPFAVGYIASLYYIVVFLQQLPKPRKRTVIMLLLAIAFTISIRIAGILMIAYLGLFVGLAWLAYAKQNSLASASKHLPRLLLLGVIAALSSYLLGILPWPYALQKPFENPFLALKSFTNWSAITSYELFEGKKLYMSALPWNYIPKLMLIMTPLFVWIGCLLALPAAFFDKKRSSIAWIIMLLFTAIFPVFYASYKDSTMFNGWRHMLFAFPPLVVMAALGWEGLIRLVKIPAARYVVMGLFLVLFAKTTAWAIKNHPNEYVYYNELVGGVNGAYGNYETDPYGNCMRQGVDWLIKNEQLQHKKALVITNQETLASSYWADELSDSVTISWTREYEVGKQRWNYALLTSRTMSKNFIASGAFPPKGTIHVIIVDDVPLVAIVKRENYYSSDGYSYFEKMQFDSAEVSFRKALETDPKNEELCRMLAASLISKGRYPESKEYLSRALAIYPENYIAIYFQGLILLNQNQPDSAISYFDRATDLKVNYADPYYGKGKARMMKKDFAQAIKEFELAYKHGGQNYKILNEAALAYFMLGDAVPDSQKSSYEKGINLSNESLQKNPNQANVYQNLGYVYLRLGNKQAAAQCYQKMNELNR